MSTWCLLKAEAERIRQALKNGEIDPEKLAAMTSTERNAFLAKFVGQENALQVNSLFESKLLLQNQKAGFISWARKLTGMTPTVKRDILSKIERMDKVLDPKEGEQFLHDLATTRLGIDVTQEEAKKISDLSKNIVDAEINYDTNKISKLTRKEGLELMKDPAKNAARLKYGDAVIELDNYVTDLKQQAEKTTLADFKRNPIKTTVKGAKTVLDLSKSMSASYDDSAILNQGFPILANVKTAPIWAKNAVNTLTNIVDTYKGKPVMDKIRADIVSRPNYINNSYKDNKLAVNVTEEQFPTSLPEKLVTVGNNNKLSKFLLSPVRMFGRGYKATEVAFNAFQLRNRADTFDLFAAMAEKSGNKDIEGLGKLVNSMTARGSMGALEPVANIVNAPFFSLRKQAANVESLLFYQTGDKSSFVRKLGATATLQQILFITTILGIARALKKDSVELDPTSADFGKIRIGSTRFDLTQGRGSYITLASRILLNRMKSSTTGNITELNTGKATSTSSTDLIGDFTQNKFSPFLNQVVYAMNRKDRTGKPPTVGSTLYGMYVPLNFTNIPDIINNPDSADLLAIAIANNFGIPTNTYPNANVKSNMIPEKTPITNDSFIHAVEVYAKALGTDPETAFNRIFTGQKIVKVTNGTVMVERMPVTESEKIKARAGANNPQMKLDHTIPLELGGDNSESNLKLVTTSQWSSYTSVENALGRALKDKKISKEDAQKLIVDFKNGKITKEQVLAKIK